MLKVAIDHYNSERLQQKKPSAIMSTYDVDILRRIEDKVLNDEGLARGANVMCELTAKSSEIRTFLKDRCVFITGATGFLGMILLEKLLRTCSEIRGIFIVMRKKKDDSIANRLNKMLDNVMFTALKKSQKNFRKKIIPVEGDIDEIGLGLSKQDLDTIHEEVSVVFHLAATIRFDEQLKKVVRTNIRGTAELIRIARGCPRLVSIVYCSTAYSQCDKHIRTEEKFYDAPYDPIELINLADNTDEAELDRMTPKLLGNFPNTYAFSKACAEDLVRREVGLPISVFRPSIVVPTYREPLGGWTTNLYGPTGIITGAGLGIMHVLHADKTNNLDLVPVDLVANAIIACAWKTSLDGVRSEPRVFNYISSNQNPLPLDKLVKNCENTGLNNPTMRFLWYYSLIVTNNWYLYAFMVGLTHFLPGLLIDAASKILGKEARLTKIYKKVWKFNNMLYYFLSNPSQFNNDNMLALWAEMNPADQEQFNFNIATIEWERYFDIMVMGIRVYIVKDPASTIPRARVIWKRYYYAHNTLKFVTGLLLCWLVYYFALMLTYVF